MRHRSRVGLFSLWLVAALLLAACGDGDEGGGQEGGGEPIRIGALTSLTGNFAPWGVQVRDGMQLAVNEINQRGGVDGRQLELVVADDQSKAEEGTRALERLIERDGVVAVGGIISSDVGLATARIAEQSKVPLFLVKAGAGGILNANSRHTFRTCLPAAPMVAGPILEYVQSKNLTGSCSARTRGSGRRPWARRASRCGRCAGCWRSGCRPLRPSPGTAGPCSAPRSEPWPARRRSR